MWTLAGMVAGALVGIGVNAALSQTGVLGPGVDELINDQTANFARIDAKLEALRGTSDPAQVRAIVTELGTLTAEQRKLTDRAAEQLRGAQQEIERLKSEALEARGSASGADLWLKEGEAATIGQPGNVFAMLAQGHGAITVNVSGKRQALAPGDGVEFPVPDATYKVIFKQAVRRTDGRIGFDVVRVEKK